MMSFRKLSASLLIFLLASAAVAQSAVLPPLKVEGRQLVDDKGNSVVLHGVMDTPNRYFNNYRWQSWKADYTDGDTQPCIEYFEKLFTAITDKSQGAYCTVFRLHLDPCWTNDPNKPLQGAGGEHNISQFSSARLTKYWTKLYSVIMEKALAHGLYVILRPPGVCPQTVKVGDEYQRYLKTVWGTIAASKLLQQYSGQVSIELANEPVTVTNADGTQTETSLRDFFQPVVDIIRTRGFKGVLWIPGSGYQSQYGGYAKYPVSDPEDNYGYAVHVYSGWYGNMTDNNCNAETFIRNFKSQVPVVETKPVMVTEIDWSPNDPSRSDEGHLNEWGQWTAPNFGSWATASSSKWGKAWRAVHDHYGNIGMTLTSTDDYLDIDEYLKTKTVRPGFQKAKDYGLFEECCAYTCFQWYKEFYEKQNTGIAPILGDSDAADVVAGTEKYYDLQGRRVDARYRGICIKEVRLSNGKTKKTTICNMK